MQYLTYPRFWFGMVLLGVCALMPVIATAIDEPFYIDMFARMMIWAIAATSLNLILGYGGMLSFGHAVYLGVGAYSVGILAYHDINNGYIQLVVAMGASALIATIFGAISLRTRGVYFIMITMALAQMVYYLSISAEQYGSDDGLVIYGRSAFGGWLDLDHPMQRYYLIFAVLVLCILFVWRVVNSRFGMVVRGAQSNETRMSAIGYAVFGYRLVCFVIAGTICGLAGFLSANVEKFVSPDMIHWKASGELIFMVVIGGMGSLLGPLAGAMIFAVLSEFLSRITEHWHIIFGPLLVLIVLFARKGIDGLFANKAKPE